MIVINRKWLTWMFATAFMICVTSQLNAQPLIHSEHETQLEIKTGKSIQIDAHADKFNYLIIYNDGIDTIASAVDIKNDIISKSATWQGRNGRYILNLINKDGTRASHVSFHSTNKFAQNGSIRLIWKKLYEGSENRIFDHISVASNAHINGNISDKSVAIDNYKNALIIAQTTDDNSWIGDIYFELGVLYFETGDLSQSITYLENSISEFRSINNTSATAIALNTIGLVSMRTGERGSALFYFNEALENSQKNNDHYQTAKILNNLALLHWESDEYEAASKLYELSLLALVAQDRLSAAEIIKLSVDQALATYEPSMVAATLNNLALTKSSLGELDYAESAWQLAQRLAESTGDRNRVAQIEQNLGKMYFHQGRLELALDYLNRALAVHQDLNNNYWIGETLTGIGNIYAAIDEHSKALDYYQQTLDLNHDHQQQFANTLTQAAWSNWQLGHIAIAKQQYQQAYDSFASSNQPGSAAVVASKYGMLQFQIGNQQQALSAQARSINILDDLDNPREAARARSRLGQLLLENGQLEQAQQVLQLALQGHRSVKDELFELDTLVALSKTQTGTAALNYAQAATQLAAQLGRHNTSTEIQIGLGVSSRDAYERHINLLVAAGEHEQAWLINEQIRARSLLRLVGESATERYGSGLTAKLDTAAIHNKLGASRVMLSYFLGAEQSHLWLIDADSVQHFTLPAADLINSSATTLAATLRDWRQSPSKINHIASILSTQILAPVADQIQDKDLVIVADGNLQSIPFGLLPVQQNQADLPVINNHSVIYTPSANVFAHLSIGHAPATKNILVLADPMGETTALSADTYRHSSLRPPQTDFDNLLALRSLSQTGINTNNLPGARLEAQAIKTISASTPQYDVTLKLGEQANRDFITSGGMRNYNIIHFATHGVIDAYVPELSGLMIASRRGQGADYLYPHDIAGLNLQADLVVLSGCETGIGKSVANEGLMSLSRPFFVAGAKQVIASLWKVSDRATAALMEQFYLHLLQADQTPEQALQSAQQWMQQQAQWQHPNFWAGFVISGA